jgi:DNA-binding transcriptional LysR family regulator
MAIRRLSKLKIGLRIRSGRATFETHRFRIQMNKLPDLEGLGVFARVAEARSFVAAAASLGLSKATVSKIVTRLEDRLGARLFHRTSRRLSLTEAGSALLVHAQRMTAEADAGEREILADAAAPQGLVRMTCPMSFGLAYVAPALPGFLAAYPQVEVDLNLSDAVCDLIGEGFDVALRIAALPDSSLMARRLMEVKRLLVAAPAYLDRRGRPTHPGQLADHACLGYAYLPTPSLWRFISDHGEEASVRPAGPLRANNADALTPALVAGRGLAVQPEFTVWRELADGRLEAVMSDWSPPPVALHLVAPPGGHRPARVVALMDFLAARFADPVWTQARRNAPDGI